MLLEQVHELVRSRGWQIGNIDSVIVAERPKLKPHLKAMQEKLAQTLSINPDQVSIKATTNEKLGSVGREEGIAAYSVILMEQEDSRHSASLP
jgi:2-C-methyl-D-erythritol 2,4-cyclodiphosphate synthase